MSRGECLHALTDDCSPVIEIMVTAVHVWSRLVSIILSMKAHLACENHGGNTGITYILLQFVTHHISMQADMDIHFQLSTLNMGRESPVFVPQFWYVQEAVANWFYNLHLHHANVQPTSLL